MSFVADLTSAGLIEKDVNNDVLWTWSYPSISLEHRKMLLRKCDLTNGLNTGQHAVSFCYCHHQQSWFYLHHTEVLEIPELRRVKRFVLVLQTHDFNPEKYEALCNILSKSFCKSGNPAEMLELYLSVLVKGSCSMRENGSFHIKQFDQKLAFSSVPAKDVVKTFGLETILIYTALMLKKRIVVYHHRLDTLLWFVRTLPAFTWHRQNWDVIYPYVEITDAEFSELINLPTYVAGFRDAAIEGRTELYDVFVNLPAVEITVATHAKETFAMTKMHKEIAFFMTRQAENPEISSDSQFIAELADKTTGLLNSLRTFSVKNNYGQDVIDSAMLKEKKFAPALENFLCNLAVAEGFLQT